MFISTFSNEVVNLNAVDKLCVEPIEENGKIFYVIKTGTGHAISKNFVSFYKAMKKLHKFAKNPSVDFFSNKT